MKKHLLLIITLVISTQTFSQVFNGDLTLSTQSEIDSFSYTEVTGKLTIAETSSGGIINLNGLTQLTTIGDGLLIDDNSSLTSLSGLESITSVGGSVDAFGEGVGINITNNNAITSISSLSNVASTDGNITIDGNVSLVTLDGLQGITSLDANVNIKNNDALISLNGLNNLTTVEGAGFFGRGIVIYNNNALTDLSGLTNLTSIIGSLEINGNDSLTSLNGLNSLSSISAAFEETGFSICNNDSLTTLNGLINLISLEANLEIYFNDTLVSLSGLNTLNHIEKNLEIKSNYNLTSLQGLDNLISIGGNLKIGNIITGTGVIFQGNMSLTTLNNLSNLTSIGENIGGGGELIITGCDSLTSLDGLENLNTLQQEYYYSPYNGLQIGTNPNGGISPISYLYNPMLSDFCGIQRLITLGEFTSTSTIVISNNANNPTISDIQNFNCTLPSPSQTVFRWRTATDNGSTITETINGITATFTGTTTTILDVSGFGSGAYSGGGFDNVIQASSNASVTFSFSDSVDIISIMVSNDNTLRNHVFTPTGGSNNVVMTSRISSGKVVLNWEGVTSFTVSTDNSYFGFDELRTSSNSSLSTNEYEIVNTRVFPNPTADYININSKEIISKIFLYNIQGQKISSYSNENKIDVRHLTNGMYFIKLIDLNNKTQTIKFLKE